MHCNCDLATPDSPKIIKGSGKVVKHSPTTIKTVVGESIGIRQNSVLMIFCEFKGTPAPVVNWNKNGEEVDPSLLVSFGSFSDIDRNFINESACKSE